MAGGSGGGGGGTPTISAANVGTGVGVYKEQVGSQLRLKTIKGGNGVQVSYTPTEVTVAIPTDFDQFLEDYVQEAKDAAESATESAQTAVDGAEVATEKAAEATQIVADFDLTGDSLTPAPSWDDVPEYVGDQMNAPAQALMNRQAVLAQSNASVLMFGADPSGINSSADAVRLALSAGHTRIRFPCLPNGNAVYYFDSVVDLGLGTSYPFDNAAKVEIIIDRGVKITRRNGGPVNFGRTLEAAKERYDGAAFAIRGNSCTVEGGFF